MNKEIQVNLRMTKEDERKLQRLADVTVRTKSDLVRLLIRKEYSLMFSEAHTTGAIANIEFPDQTYHQS